MPSPFPGWTRTSKTGLWPGVHNYFIAEMMATLNAQLRPRYYASLEERVYLSDEDDPGRSVIIPDVRILPSRKKRTAPAGGGAVAPARATAAEPVIVTTLFDEEIHESFIRVVERQSRQVVTVIELLSPTNKVAGSRGRADYREKRAGILRSETHWVEIDLLRAGEPVVARELYPACEYTVHVSRAGHRPKAAVWPIGLREPLPVITIPLQGTEPGTPLDLQSLLTITYDRGAYDLRLDYTKDPTPSLSPDLAKWATALLKRAKLR